MTETATAEGPPACKLCGQEDATEFLVNIIDAKGLAWETWECHRCGALTYIPKNKVEQE